MDIFLLRHGKYDQNQTDQPLSAKGKEQMDEVGGYLFSSGISIDKILSSPKARAKESARIVASKIGFDPGKIIETPFLKPSSSASEIVHLAENKPTGKVLLTGHLPSLAEAASLLLTENEKTFIRFDTATLCHIFVNSFHPLSCELLSLIRPNV